MFNIKPVVIDLFAGAGGFGLGFQLSGFETPLSLEIDQWACDTLRYNHPLMKVIQGDIRDFNTESLIKEACPFTPDVIIGGPPCQGFSIAGPAQKDPNDPRNTLFMNFAQWVGVLQPKVFIMENVKGLLARKNTDGDKVIEIIKRTFRDLGYFVEVWLLNAAEYGVPQQRERIAIVGHHLGTEVGKPKPSHSIEAVKENGSQMTIFKGILQPAITLYDAISDLPELGAGEGLEEQAYTLMPLTEFQQWARGKNQILYNHVAMEHSPRLVERFKHIKWGESSSDVPAEHGAWLRNGNGERSNKKYDQNNRRLHPYKPSHTIAASFYANFVHPFQHRNLTAREGARVQSFPDWYRFMGKKTVVSRKLLQREERVDENYLCQYNQVGNAVPPRLAQAIADHIKDILERPTPDLPRQISVPVVVSSSNTVLEGENTEMSTSNSKAMLPNDREVLIHGSNLRAKETHKTKYTKEIERKYLAEIRIKYDEWHKANMNLVGPGANSLPDDKQIIYQRIQLLEDYKKFLDQQHYAETFDSRSNLHSSVLEEFLYYLFKDIVADYGHHALIGKSHAFKDIFFVPPRYSDMLKRPYGKIEKKDHDFVIGSEVQATFISRTPDNVQTPSKKQLTLFTEEPTLPDEVKVVGDAETHKFDLPAIVIECKTYLDKTMLEGSSRAAEELKARIPNALYIVVMEWIKLSEAVNLRKYKVDQIYVFRKQKNTDREFRFDDDYIKNPIDPEVVYHLFETVRRHLTEDWTGGVEYGLQRGWLIG
jgi:DNA (cytosine-5)-methyltransferase 1